MPLDDTLYQTLMLLIKKFEEQGNKLAETKLKISSIVRTEKMQFNAEEERRYINLFKLNKTGI